MDSPEQTPHTAAPVTAASATAADVAIRCAERMYATDRASQHLGIEITDVAPGRAQAAMTVADTMVNGHDLCHGGYVFLLADTAFAFACNTYDHVTVAAACDVVFVRSALRGQRLVATAAERARYGRSGIYDVTVRTADGELVAEFRGRSRTQGSPILDGDAVPPDA